MVEFDHSAKALPIYLTKPKMNKISLTLQLSSGRCFVGLFFTLAFYSQFLCKFIKEKHTWVWPSLSVNDGFHNVLWLLSHDFFFILCFGSSVPQLLQNDLWMNRSYWLWFSVGFLFCFNLILYNLHLILKYEDLLIVYSFCSHMLLRTRSYRCLYALPLW